MLHYSSLPYAYGEPAAHARIKSQPADFQVEETLAYSLTGEGEHLWLWLEKQGENTDWAAQQLAKWAGIRLRDIGYAGLKDRHGITRQWFSLYLPGRENPDFSTFQFDSMRILKHIRHQRKLQTGGLSGNRFILTLRDVSGDQAEIEQRLEQIKTQGVPNYFGEQRFGRNEHNLAMAQRLFDGELTRLKPAQRGLYISAARSFLFNEILAERVRQNAWHQAWSGDVFQLEGSEKWFVDDGSIELSTRVKQLDIHPTGALVGSGDLASQHAALKLETQVLSKHQAWCQALTDLGLKQERRALRMLPKNLSWQWLDNKVLQVDFGLAPGRYATVVMRELAKLSTA
ncbi:tRNA pseudouridine(13) synthase TruD [Thiomicrospira sp.]|uniref:tRNA pseudouridine(13) synthase TruD n=1 Tax=Thiomicrospira sp. TaxID=935 RepID=UPI002F938AC7